MNTEASINNNQSAGNTGNNESIQECISNAEKDRSINKSDVATITSESAVKETSLKQLNEKCGDETLNKINNDKIISSQENNNIISQTQSIEKDGDSKLYCKICSYHAVKKRNVLICHKCNGLIHFHCTNLPPYMIFTLSTSTKKYVCEICADTPEKFLESIMKVDMISDSIMVNKYTEAQKTGYENLEYRVNQIDVMLEKYDMAAIAENLLDLGRLLEKAKNNMHENVGILKNVINEQSIAKLSSRENGSISVTDENENSNLSKELEGCKSELNSYKKSYELMIETVTERDGQVKHLTEGKQKISMSLQEKNLVVANLDMEVTSLKRTISKLNEEKEKHEKEYDASIVKLENINTEMGKNMEDLTKSHTYTRSRWEAVHVANELLTSQIKEAHAMNKRLEENLTLAISNNKEQINNVVQNVELSDHSTPNDEKVIILHDSMCKDINDTILSKEQIITKKIWAPNLEEMNKILDDIRKTDVIVVQALTRDLAEKQVNEMIDGVNTVVTKALSKAKKVVISLIVRRDDDIQLRAKAEVINANISYAYIDNQDVIICENVNLNEKKYRKPDGVHLTTHGTSVLATNLKYKIADALNITVIKKDRYDNKQRNQMGYRPTMYNRENTNNSRYENWGYSSPSY